MSDLAEFLLARIAEDEEAARLAARLGPQWQPGGPGAWAEATTVLASDGKLPRSGRSVAEVDDVAAAHVLAWDPARVLAECEAKRRIVELHRMGGEYTPGDDQRDGFRYCATCGSGEPYEYPTEWPCTTLRLLALPYADHPDYRQEWRP